MSFSTELKNELGAIQIKRRCCREALAAGLIFDAETADGGRVLASYSTAETAAFAGRVLAGVYGREAVPAGPSPSGTKRYDLALVSGDASERVGRLADFCCAECRICFVRGLFIASGSVTDPSRQYHFEILLSDEERAGQAAGVLEELFGVEPRVVLRKNGYGIIIKNSMIIEDMLMSLGASRAYFEFVNSKIERDLRGNANRATNCETRNIARSVNATEAQVTAIEALKAMGEFEKLAPELRESAELRLLYPDLPLSELAARHCPPITKSGLNHRLGKIIEVASKL